MERYTLGIDIGTTSVKVILISSSGCIAAESTRPHNLLSPHLNWAEENAEVWWSNTVDAVREIASAHPEKMQNIASVGCSGMVPALVLLDGAGASGAVEEVDGGADDLLYRRDQHARGVVQQTDVAAARGGAEADQQHDREHQHGYADPVCLQIVFHSSSTPCNFSICPSRHSGRPITLKKSPSMPRTNSAALPCAP